MRRAFEENLKSYKAIAKDELELGEDESVSDEELETLTNVLEWHVGKAAEKRQTSEGAQLKIYEMQKEKQFIMQQMAKRVNALDDKEATSEMREDAYQVSYDDEGLKATIEDGSEVTVSVGDIMTDMSWDLHYDLDDSVPRAIRKRYIVEEAKEQIRDLLDRQIEEDEVGSDLTHEWQQQAYVGHRSSIGHTEKYTGHVAETMVLNYFKKLTYDTDVDIKVIPADVFEDVAQKIDFIIHRKSHTRGVDVQESAKQDVGIQFTMNTSSYTLRKKRQQIDMAKKRMQAQEYPIDDIILVAMGKGHGSLKFKQWNQTRLPGGPDQLWDDELKKTILDNVLAGVMTKDEIEEQWGKIAA